MKLQKTLWFDENSMPSKNAIWYRGEGKFYEFKNGEWVVAYDLNSMPSQEEQEELVAAIQEKNPEFVVDESKSLLPQILEGIVEMTGKTNDSYHIIEVTDTAEYVSWDELFQHITLDGERLSNDEAGWSKLFYLDFSRTLIKFKPGIENLELLTPICRIQRNTTIGFDALEYSSIQFEAVTNGNESFKVWIYVDIAYENRCRVIITFDD